MSGGLKILSKFRNGLAIAENTRIKIWRREQDVFTDVSINSIFTRSSIIKSIAEFQEYLLILYEISQSSCEIILCDVNQEPNQPRLFNIPKAISLAKLNDDSLIIQLPDRTLTKLEINGNRYTHSMKCEEDRLIDLRNGFFLGFSGDFSRTQPFPNSQNNWELETEP
jgi:hypothetical protein